MATIENVQERYGLPRHIAKSIVDNMAPGEEIITQFGYRRLEWLKENIRQAGHRFLAVSVTQDVLNIYVMTDQGIGTIDFTFHGDDPSMSFGVPPSRPGPPPPKQVSISSQSLTAPTKVSSKSLTFHPGLSIL